MKASWGTTATLQRKCACGKNTSHGDCENCQKSSLERDPSVKQNSDFGGSTSSSSGLSKDLASQMGSRFGGDFSGVRLHTDESAGREALDLGARAFTRNGEVYFAPGHFRPDTTSGLGLIAHELTHVAQQRNGRVNWGGVSSLSNLASTHDALEEEAITAERRVSDSSRHFIAKQVADPNTTQRSVSDVADAMKSAATGGIQAVAEWVVSNFAATDSLIKKLSDLKTELTNTSPVITLKPEAVAALGDLYHSMREKAPFWLPVPNIQFVPIQTAAPLIIIGGVALGILEILLILAFLIVMVWFLQRLDPKTRKAQDQAVEDLIAKLKESTRPRGKPEPEKEPDPEKKPPPTTIDPIPVEKDRKRPQPYPICWATQLGLVPALSFVRTKSERDEDEAVQARLESRKRELKDPDFISKDYHIHHVIPLFLGGPDDLRNNGTLIPKGIHLKGHRVLQFQPQMQNPPQGLPPLPINLYEHAPGTMYRLVGYKETQDEKCSA